MELERKKGFLIKTGYYTVSAVLVVVAMRYLWTLLLPVMLGFLIAYMLQPTTNFIARHSKIGRRGASIVSAIVFYAVITALVWLLTALLLVQFDNLSASLPGLYSDAVQPLLADINARAVAAISRFAPHAAGSSGQIFNSINSALENIFVSASTWGMSVLTGLLRGIPMFALALVITILSSVLISVDYADVTGFVLRQIPQRLHSTILDVRDFLATTILKIVKAYLILMVITFAELAAGLWLLGTKKVLLMAAIIAFLDLLPILGSGSVLIPWGVYLLCVGDIFTGAGLILLWVAVSFLHEVLEPRIVGREIGLHPLATLTAMYCGLRLAGFGGLILAPVVCLLIKYLHDNDLWKIYKS